MKDNDEFESNFIRPELSMEECKSILCLDGEEYTDGEIKEIRELILKLIEIDFHYFHTVQKQKAEAKKVIDIKQGEDQTKPYKKAG